MILLHFLLLPLAYEGYVFPEWSFRVLRIARDANIVMALWFLLPIRIPGYAKSDGRLILDLIQSKSVEEYLENNRADFENNVKSDKS